MRERTKKPIESRFWCKVEKTEGGCWEWRGARIPQGYGTFHVRALGQDRRVYAHRMSYLWANGTIPEGMDVMHTCHNRGCVNPDHLTVGTRKENMQSSAADGRKLGRKINPESKRQKALAQGKQRFSARHYGPDALPLPDKAA